MRNVLLILLAALWALPSWAADDDRGAALQRAKVHTELAGAYFSRAQFGIAIQELEIALAADPSYAPAHNVLGLVYMELREDDKAEEHFRRALRLAPNDSEASNNYGWFLCQRKRYDESVRHFLAAIKNPLYATPEKAYYNAGVCTARKGDLEGAEEFLTKALKLQPGFAGALYQLADIKYKQGDFGAARQHIGAYLRDVPSPTAEALWLGVRVARKLGDRDAEASYGLTLRKRFPDSKEALALRDAKFE